MGFDRLWNSDIFVPGVLIKEVVFQGMGKPGKALQRWSKGKERILERKDEGG